jgi:hypothetical protein
MTGAGREVDPSERLTRLVFIYTLLGAAAFIGAVLVYVL